MVVKITFELDETWDEYKDCHPELLVEDMDVIQKDGVRVLNVDVVEE